MDSTAQVVFYKTHTRPQRPRTPDELWKQPFISNVFVSMSELFRRRKVFGAGAAALQIPDVFKSEPEERRKMSASLERLFLKVKQCLFALDMELFVSLSR